MRKEGDFVHNYLLASSKMSGSSLASFSLATSAIGPKITTGLRNPAVQEQDRVMEITKGQHYVTQHNTKSDQKTAHIYFSYKD